MVLQKMLYDKTVVVCGALIRLRFKYRRVAATLAVMREELAGTYFVTIV
jgi:hypothetical protein